MSDHLLARPWIDIRPQIETDGVTYELRETRSSRDFFAVDETSPYVVRVQECDGRCVFTLTPAPARSTSVAACEEALR